MGVRRLELRGIGHVDMGGRSGDFTVGWIMDLDVHWIPCIALMNIRIYTGSFLGYRL